MYIKDLQGRVLEINNALAKALKMSNEEICGKTSHDLHSKDVADVITRNEQKVVETGEPLQFEEIVIHHDGIPHNYLTTKFPLRDADSQLYAVAGISIDISDRKQKEKELEIQTNNLEEVNTALRVLLKKREEDKLELEEKVMSNVKQLVRPYLEKLKSTQLDEKQKTFIDILESNLEDLISPFSHSLSTIYSGLTPTEIQVADLVKQGRNTKEIGDLMSLSWKTIKTHRGNIRAKLKLKNKKSNLRSYLLSIH